MAGNSAGGVPAWAVLAAGGICALGHHVARAHELYVAPQGSAPGGAVAAALGVTTSVVIGCRFGAGSRRGRRATTSRLLGLAAAAALVVGVAPFAAFDRGALAVPVAVATVGTGALVTTLAAIETWRAVGPGVLSLGLVEGLLRPLRLLGLVAVLAATLGLEAHVGFVRSGVLIALGLALVAGTSPSVLAWMEGTAASSREARTALVVSCAVAIAAGAVSFAADSRLPLAELARYPDEPVFTSDGDAHRYVVTAAPGGYELFRDGQLAVATLDAERAARALAVPVLAAVSGPRRVLLLGGTGSVERAILTDPGVTSLTVVSDDAETGRLGRVVPFLARIGADAAHDAPRASRVTAEPLVWLSEHADTWDVVVAAFPAPTSYAEGKLYTRYTFQMIAAHLTPRGATVIPATSAWSAGDAFASVVVTAKSAGLRVRTYHASLPTLGVASFVVGSRDELPRASFDAGLSALAARGALDVGLDLREPEGGAVATLHDEQVVDAFELARERAGDD